MKPTGLFNTITGEPIMQAEESDLALSKDWDELSLEEKADFLSFLKYPFLNKDVEPGMKVKWEYFQKKNGYR